MNSPGRAARASSAGLVVAGGQHRHRAVGQISDTGQRHRLLGGRAAADLGLASSATSRQGRQGLPSLPGRGHVSCLMIRSNGPSSGRSGRGLAGPGPPDQCGDVRTVQRGVRQAEQAGGHVEQGGFAAPFQYEIGPVIQQTDGAAASLTAEDVPAVPASSQVQARGRGNWCRCWVLGLRGCWVVGAPGGGLTMARARRRRRPPIRSRKWCSRSLRSTRRLATCTAAAPNST